MPTQLPARDVQAGLNCAAIYAWGKAASMGKGEAGAEGEGEGAGRNKEGPEAGDRRGLFAFPNFTWRETCICSSTRPQ